MPPKKTTPAAKASSKPAVKKTGKSPAKKPSGSTAAKVTAPKREPIKVGVTIQLKQLVNILKDGDGTIKNTGRWPLVIDPSGRAGTFLRYQDTNYLQALSPDDMQPETIRKALIGSIRHGKTFTIDMIESDMYGNIKTQMDEIQKGLLDCLLSKDLLKDEKYLTIVKESDGGEYGQYKFNDLYMNDFVFVLVTQMSSPGEELLNKFYTVTILEN
ncbi:IQ motif and ankyrin repeat domain-containing protein 1-like [Saccoglossus kowalevskii]|uniref:IQ motif and ankyrin repeat domain-containing protein LOC642574-like n=1 Tax=Saccoglossus kowalevskii TaxID=10224 RepID=A0ABM0GPE1_SACKO|nr:PREDICTED: putative IQ motif and ankyrin repeat domain-containing protein LOC642574-like [Saccoglossus kowalevskii]